MLSGLDVFGLVVCKCVSLCAVFVNVWRIVYVQMTHSLTNTNTHTHKQKDAEYTFMYDMMINHLHIIPYVYQMGRN